jgi:hypothetical protein
MAVKKVLVYQSKDEEDWKKAKGLLTEGGIPFNDWASEEVGACGCGAKLDIRKFGRKEPIPTRIFHIEVEPADGDVAKKLLKGAVKPVLSYGYNF